MLSLGHFRVVQSQFKVGGMCTSTSYGRLQLGTLPACFLCDWVFVFSCHYYWTSCINCLCWYDYSCMDSTRMCGL